MARAVVFVAPHDVEVREVDLPPPGPEEVRVEADRSAISSGTELLVYRGEISSDLPTDATIESLSGTFSYPLQYGYAVVGTVTAVGDGIDSAWRGTRVFAFHPHMTEFNIGLHDITPIPQDWPSDAATLLANLEAATNFLLDGTPRIGERVLVLGQGVLGLLTTALLSEFPLTDLITADLHQRRRTVSEQVGADISLDPMTVDIADRTRSRVDAGNGPDGVDVTFELSGNPSALETAIDATGYGGRIMIGSWYGTKPVEVPFDGRFHRSRIRLQSTQVSTIDPTLRGRWTRSRRLETVRQWLPRIETDPLVTHRFRLDEAAEAYRLLDSQPEEAIQVLLTY